MVFRRKFTYEFGVKLITYSALGLCDVDKAHIMVEKGDNTVSGELNVNLSAR